MEDQLITFETAKLAKEKGFDINTKNFYYINDLRNWHEDGEIGEGFDDEYWGYNSNLNWNKLEKLPFKPFCDCVAIPTQSLLQKWLREKHNIIVESNYKWFNKRWSFYPNFMIIGESWDSSIDYDNNKIYSYEEALEIALQEALKLIK